jgi:hypothetical protein
MKVVCLNLAVVLAVLVSAGSSVAQVPVITGFSPSEGPIGSWVGIEGTNLLYVTAVEFNGLPAQLFSGMIGLHVTAKVPEGATTGSITVRTPNGSVTTTNSFKVVDAPKPLLLAVSPGTGVPGETVRLIGSNLVDVVSVEFNGVEASFSNIFVPDWMAIVPTGATTGPITIRTRGGVTTSTNDFVVLPPPVIGPPVVSSFSPTEGIPGTLVTIEGTNFEGLVSISFGGVESAGSWMANSPNTRVPTNGVTGPITVTTTHGSCTTKDIFTVLPLPPPPPPAAPMVNYFIPWEGEVGTSVRIQGGDFGRVTDVQVNGVSVAFNIERDPMWGFAGAITIVIPPNATTGPITVISPEGSATWTRDFTVVPKPVVTGFMPDHGTPGTVVELVGSNLEQIVRLRLGSIPLAYDGPLRAFTVPLEAVSGAVTVVSHYSEILTPASFIVTHDNDLGVTDSVSLANAVVPTAMHYSIVVTNKGSLPGDNVVLVNRFARTNTYVADGFSLFPERPTADKPGNLGIEVTAASANQGQCLVTNGMVQCELGSIGGGQTAMVEIWLRATLPGVVYHLAKVNSGHSDPDPRDNQWVSTASLVAAGELQIRKLDGNQLEIRWPNGSRTWSLTSADSPGPIQWKPVSGRIVGIDNWNVVTEPVSVTARIYRLESTDSP